MQYKLGIIPERKPTMPEQQYILRNRDVIVHMLVTQYNDEHPGINDELSLWTAFKSKKPVQDLQGRQWWIHSIQSYMRWENNTVDTKYYCRRNKDGLTDDEKEKAINNQMVSFTAKELNIIGESDGNQN